MFLNQAEVGTDYEFVTDLGNRLESRENDIYVRAASNLGDEITLKAVNSFENVPAQFFLPRNVLIPAGRYDWTNLDVRIRSFDGRPLRLDWEITCCSFYGGRSVYSKLQIAYRPSAYFEFVPTWEATYISQPGGYVGVHILSLDSVVNFIPDMQLSLQAQFDNISRGVGFSARYGWEYEPGNEIFVAFGQSALIPGTTFKTGTSQLSIRLGHTFRF